MKLLIFDLDGTLIDSKLDLVHSVNAARAHMDLPPISADLVASYVGSGAPVLMRRALGPDASEADVQRALRYFLDYYRDHMLDNTYLYPGVRQALDRMHDAGMPMAVLTNKPVHFSREMLARLGLASRFAYIYGGNSFPKKKPDPMGLHKLMEDLHVPAHQTLMVGDSDTDILTGRNAGVWTCGVNYGFGAATLQNVSPDRVIGDLRELPPLLDRHG